MRYEYSCYPGAHSSFPFPHLWTGTRFFSFVARGSGQALSDEGVGDLNKAGDIGAVVVVAGGAVLLGGVLAPVVDILHNLFELLVSILEAPGLPSGVLLHLQGRDGHPTGVGRFPRGVGDAG